MTVIDDIYAEAAQYPDNTKIEVTLTPQGTDLKKPILVYLNENVVQILVAKCFYKCFIIVLNFWKKY